MTENYENPLPNIEPATWLVKKGELYFVDEGIQYRVKKLAVIANGTKDLCVCLDEKGYTQVKKIVETPSERVLFRPNTDIIWFEFEKPIRGTQWSIICEADGVMKKMLRRIMDSAPTNTLMKGKDFNMYAGEDW